MLYTVIIGANRYRSSQQHSNLDDAIDRMEKTIKRHQCIVLRDGKTGKRYTVADVRSGVTP